MEHLTSDMVNVKDKAVSGSFKTDTSIDPNFRAIKKDYERSGYHRGHLAAADNHKYDQLALDETFFLINVAPQVTHFVLFISDCT
jgi:endonuclease G